MSALKQIKLTLIFLLFLLALSSCLTLHFAGEVEAQSRAVWAKMEDGVSIDQLNQIVEYAKADGGTLPKITLWKSGGQKTAESGLRSFLIELTVLHGDPFELFPASFFCGSFPAPSDTGGCALDRLAAEKLFGGHDVLNMPLTIDGRTYTVRGVFEGDEGAVILQGGEDTAELFPNLRLRFEGGGSRMEAEQFFQKWGLNSALILDAPLMGEVLSLLALFPALALCAAVLIQSLAGAIRLRRCPLLLLLYAAPAFLLSFFSLRLLGPHLSLPDRLIPTMWSDFGFFKTLVQTALASARRWFMGTPDQYDTALLGGVLLTGLFLLLSLLFAALLISRAKLKTGKEVCVYSILFMLFMLFCASVLPNGLALEASSLLPPALLFLSLWLQHAFFPHQSAETSAKEGSHELTRYQEHAPYADA